MRHAARVFALHLFHSHQRHTVNMITNCFLACVASVSVGLGSKESKRNGIFGVLPARKMVRQPKRGKRGRGRGRKETLADKPLDFENRLLDLSCLSAHTKISCCHRLSELSRTLSRYARNNELTKRRNLEKSERPMQFLKLQFQN